MVAAPWSWTLPFVAPLADPLPRCRLAGCHRRRLQPWTPRLQSHTAFWTDASVFHPPIHPRIGLTDSPCTRTTCGCDAAEDPLTARRSPPGSPGPEDELPRKGPGRPRVHTEVMQKTNVQLRTDDLVYLDRLTADIRDATGAAMTRSAILRPLLAALRKSDIDLRQVRSEAELERLFRARLQK